MAEAVQQDELAIYEQGSDWLLPSVNSYQDESFDLVPEGPVEVQLVEVEAPTEGTWGWYRKGIYELTDGEFAGRRLSKIFSLSDDGVPLQPMGSPGDLFDAVVYHKQDADGRTWARLAILPPEAPYLWEVVKVGEAVPTGNQKNPKQVRRPITFEIKGDGAGQPCEWDGYRQTRNYTWTMWEQGNLYPVVKAAMGGALDPDIQYGPQYGVRRDPATGAVVRVPDAGLEGKRLMNTISHAQGKNGGVFANLGNSPYPVPKARPGRARKDEPQVTMSAEDPSGGVPF